jgi:beta-fructofuranosidase
MLVLRDSWVWDFWLADTGREWHLFFLQAPRSLGDPDLRHRHARVGHAVSGDLRQWEIREDVLAPGHPGAFDDTATWTGSVVRGDDGAWRMFYTGMSARDGAYIQRIGVAISEDLDAWRKQPAGAVPAPDPRWYEQYGDSTWPGDAWRDPWVFRDPDGDGWHMLVTARANHGPVDDRGVIGHARSADLERWEVMPPLSAPGAGFGHLEASQVEVVDGRPVLVFSCKNIELGGERARSGASGGVWAVAASGVVGPFDTANARLLADERLFAGRIVTDRTGQPFLLAFLNGRDARSFVGALGDPIPVEWQGETLTLREGYAPATASRRRR